MRAGIGPALLATGIAVTSAGLGLSLGGAHRRARLVVPFSAGVLLGVALFGLLPEIAATTGWAMSSALFAAGYALLFTINRYAYPVCPSCSHDHDHNSCSSVLHGFAAPLITATSVHAFLDGWSMATAQSAGFSDLRLTLPLAVVLHKVPEGVALGAILWASMRSRPAAFAWAVIAESCTILGSLVGLALAPRLGVTWILYPLGLAGGCFFFLGFHAVHEEWKRRGAVPAFMPAITGAAGAAALQQGVHALLR
jgi:zinc transporter ZupT